MSVQVDSDILKRFKFVQMIGNGHYDVVWKVFDQNLKQLVALKKMSGALVDTTTAQRAFRELCFLHQMQGCDYIVELLQVFKAHNDCDLYASYGILESDLKSIIKTNALTDLHKRYITCQLIYALKYLHSRKLIHRDIKPSNILINSDCTIRLSDFGLACSAGEDEETSENLLSAYKTDDLYRSPELLLTNNKYLEGIDMWSVGCIVAEMYLGKPLIYGDTIANILTRIIGITGQPDPLYVESLNNYSQEFLKPLRDAPIEKIDLEKEIPNAPKDAIDFIQQCLIFIPEKRMTSETSIRHKYIRRFITRESRDRDAAIAKGPIIYPNTKDFYAKDFRTKIYDELIPSTEELKIENSDE